MVVPEPKRASSNTWFIQMRLGGQSVYVTAQTAAECKRKATLIKAEHKAGKRVSAGPDMTLRDAIDNYINARKNVLSPSTIRGYNAIRENRFKSVMGKPIKNINSWQNIVNQEAALCSAKTLTNAWRFVGSVLREAGAEVPDVRLPQIARKEKLFLEPDQILQFVDAVKGKTCEIAALLALHSLRLSEILALTWDKVDLKNRRILVAGAAVRGEDHKLVYKQENKNASSARYVPIFIGALYDALSAVEDKTGRLVTLHHNTLWGNVNRVCRGAGLPEVGIHGLRHSFASLAYHLQVPELIAMQIGGWSDSGTMRKIYTHLAQKDVSKYETALADFFKNAT